MTDEAPVYTTYRTVMSRDGAVVLIVAFSGVYGHGSQGNGDAHKMSDASEHALAASPEAEGVVLDGTDLDYQWGDEIGRVQPTCGLPWAWVISDGCAAGLTSYIEAEMNRRPEEWLFRSLERAIEVVGERCRSVAYSIHDHDGRIEARFIREPRGRRESSFAEGRVRYETLWVGRRIIERLWRNESGEVEWSAHWPFPDAARGESEACLFGARVVYEGGRVRTLDFNPAQTDRELNPEWLAAAGSAAGLRELILDGTSITDEDVASVVAACPTLESLSLNGTRVSERVLTTLTRAPALRKIDLFDSTISSHVLRAFAQTNPSLRIAYAGMFDR